MPFNLKTSGPWQRYLIAAIVVAIAAFVRAEFLGYLGSRLPLVTFFPAVLFVTFFVSFSAGLLAALLSLIYVGCWLTDPFGQILVFRGSADKFLLAASLSSGVVMSLVALARNRAQKRRAEANAQAELAEQRSLGEADLRESEARYRVLFENSLDAIILTLPGGEIVSANRAASELFGMTQDELCRVGCAGIFDTHFAFVLPEPDAPGRVMGEITCLRKDGARFPAEVSCVMLNDGSSSFTILRDITQRKRAQEELRRSEDRFRGIFENSPLGIFQSAPKGQAVRVNPSIARMLGYQYPQLMVEIDKEVAGRFFLHPEQREAIVQTALDTGSYAQGEVDLCRKDGSHFVANLHLRAKRVEGGIFAEGFVEDINARKQAEEALRKSELQFRQMADAVKEVFWLTSPDFQTTHYVSPAFQRIWGYSGAELQAAPLLWMEAIHPDDLAQVERDLGQMARGTAVEMQYRITRPDGAQRWISDRGYPLRDETGKVTLISGVASDITERKQAEVALKRYAQRLIALEENLRMRIANEIHDDVAQVVTALGLNLSFIGTYLQDASGNDLRGKLDDSRVLTKEISRTVRNLMVELRPVQLEEYGLVAAVRSHVEQFTKRTGIEVLVHADPQFPRLAARKEITLFRITQEALVNVAKHAEAEQVVIVLRCYDGCIGLSVTDDGKGFAAQDTPRLATGSGWGLTIMRERAELAGGRLELQTEPGEGTCIFVEIQID
jgi:PAS domain S-box-containing protein